MNKPKKKNTPSLSKAEQLKQDIKVHEDKGSKITPFTIGENTVYVHTLKGSSLRVLQNTQDNPSHLLVAEATRDEEGNRIWTPEEVAELSLGTVATLCSIANQLNSTTIEAYVAALKNLEEG